MSPDQRAWDEVDALGVNTIRTLAIDAIQKANSGHPGTPMALAPVAYVLWQRFLRFDPEDPIWPNRDRFVLSVGHASMLLYALLHLSGVRAVDPDYETLGNPSVSLDDIKCFRQLDSRAAGHPEYRWTSGVEATTGPLGQGVATSVGMAIASQWLGARYNREDAELFDFDVYAFCGDGDLMEGVSSEAASIAGHQHLDNLCWVYDNNHISIDGRTEITYEDDVYERFREGVGARGRDQRTAWERLFDSYRGANPDLAAEIEAMQRRELPDGWDSDLPSYEPGDGPMATRKASNRAQSAVASRLPWLLAGSADLTDSTSVALDPSVEGATAFEPGNRGGRQLHYGIREHDSAAISNGMSLSKLRPLWSTYLVFSDYARPAIRLSALMELPVIHLFTHDSIGLGEDGPTHQPVEQLASLRAIPGLDVIRPCDANEVAEAWRCAIGRHHQPVALVLTRQNVPIFDRS